MTAEATSVGTATSMVPQPVGRRTLAVLRGVSALHAAAMLAQPVLAGQYLDGDLAGLNRHGINAFVVAAFDVLQLGAAVAFGWKGCGAWWPTWASLVIAVLVEIQVGFGYAAVLAVHVPLGVSLILAQSLVIVWLFDARAEVARPARAGRRGRAGSAP